jgi:nicotinamide mononucleotide adenylyltransferase
MSTIVIMPGGFHPFHAGHAALYQSAVEAFPGAEVFVAATNDTSTRPFPFAIKEKLAQLAGVKPGHFVQVKSPFRAEEITAKFDPAKDRLIFVRSEKDANKPPQAGGTKKDGSPAYLQLLAGQTNIRPFKEHAYMAYLPTVEFGPGMTSATEIRTAWPQLNDKRKQALVMSLYPQTQSNPALAANVVKMLDTAMGEEQSVSEMDAQNFVGGMTASYQARENQPIDEDYIDEKWSQKYKSSINCANPKGFSQRAHCAGRKK